VAHDGRAAQSRLPAASRHVVDAQVVAPCRRQQQLQLVGRLAKRTSEQNVVTPKRWLKAEDISTQDLIPQGWIRL
jgi:hypothetical protein